MPKIPSPPTPKEVLQKWAEDNEISPTDFAAHTGYTYNHAYQLLCGKKVDVTIDTAARIAITPRYGFKVAEPIFEALRRQWIAEGKITVIPVKEA